MSTRCNIVLKEAGKPDIWLYHHHDGYPEGVGADLEVLVDNLNRGWYWGYYGDELKDLANWMCNEGVPSQRGSGLSGLDRDYEHTEGQHGDIEYLYTITKIGEKYDLRCQSVTYKNGDYSNPNNWKADYEYVTLSHTDYTEPEDWKYCFIPDAQQLNYREACSEMKAHQAWANADQLEYGGVSWARDGTFVRVRNARQRNSERYALTHSGRNAVCSCGKARCTCGVRCNAMKRDGYEVRPAKSRCIKRKDGKKGIFHRRKKE